MIPIRSQTEELQDSIIGNLFGFYGLISK